MSRPGVETVITDAAPVSGAQTDTGTTFLVGETVRGPVTSPIEARSLTQLEALIGGRAPANPHVFNAAEAAFREGAGRVVVGRLADATAKAASVSGTTFDLVASSPGTWGNQVTVTLETAVTAAAATQAARRQMLKLSAPKSPSTHVVKAKASSGGPAARDGDGDGPFMVVVTEDGQVVERSLPTLTTAGDLVAWAASRSTFITVTATDPGAALTTGSWTLEGGTDGPLVTSPEKLLDACLQIPGTAGPGQLLAPGKFSPAQHEAVLVACEIGNRRALLDPDPSLDTAGLIAHTQALRELETDKFGGLFAGQAIVPGGGGTRRTILWSGIQAGLIARLDAEGNPNRPAMGERGISRFAIGLAREFGDDDRETLTYAGVNTPAVINATVRGYGFRTIAAQDGPRGQWVLLSNSRLAMAVKALADNVAERFVGEMIDGAGFTFADFRAALVAEACQPFWSESGPSALYGATADEAYLVDVGPEINTPDTIADLQIRAVIWLRMSPFAELVRVEIVKQAITEPLPVAA